MNILSIKGGGVRGIIVTRFLVEIEKITNTPISKLFHYFGGSSVGALVTSGILLSEDQENPIYTAEALHTLFLNHFHECFSWTYYSYITSVFGLLGAKYTNDGLSHVVHKCCSDYQLKHLLKPVIFPAFDRISSRSYYFDSVKDADVPLKQVILGCSAAPTVFPSYKVEMNGRMYDLADSGLVVNNGSELTYLWATKELEQVDKSKIFLLNIGTGMFDRPLDERNGLWTWGFNIADTLMHASSENEMYELSLSLSSDNYFVLDVPLDIKYYQTDNTTPAAIEHYLLQTDMWIKENQDKIEAFCHKLIKNIN